MVWRKWFRFEAGEAAEAAGLKLRDIECLCCGQEFDRDDVVVSRGDIHDDLYEVFCSTGCGVVYEREAAGRRIAEEAC